MVRWNEKLYYGEAMKKKHRRTIHAINTGRKIRNVYCIAFASNQNNLFDILPASELNKPHLKNTEIQIIGLALGKDEATMVVQEMILEVYRATGEFKVREYFSR